MEQINKTDNDLNENSNKELKIEENSNSDGGFGKNEVELTDRDKFIIQMLYSKKYWALKTLINKEQVNLIEKLVNFGDDNYKKQREEIFGTPKLDEYQYFVSEVFNSNFLTYDALIKLSSFLYKKEPLTADYSKQIKSIWKNPFNDLDRRDVSGKRDRLKVMIGPIFLAKIIAAHIKLAEHFKKQNLLDNADHQQKFYDYIIQTAEREYSKLNKEFWSTFLLYVVVLSFLVTLIGVIVTALLSLVGFASLAPFAVLLVTTLITVYFKFNENYKIWPWDWVYWWKDAAEKCLICLKSEYMKEILCEGKTDKTLDKELPIKKFQVNEKPVEQNASTNENLLENKFINEESNKLDHDNSADEKFSEFKQDNYKKSFKANRKLCLSLCKFFATISIVAVLTYFFPAVVASIISSMLTVFKISLTLTIPASVVSASLLVAILAFVVAAGFFIEYKSNAKQYLQKKFDLYQKDFSPQGDKYFMKFGNECRYYTADELKKKGIKVKVQEPKKQLDNNNTEAEKTINEN